MVDLLAHYGKRVDHVKYMYYSPFREEDSPSMCIREKDGMDIWVDYGAALTEEDRKAGRKFHGGGLIDMAMELGGLSKKEAVELLKTIQPGTALMMNDRTVTRNTSKVEESGIVIEKINERFTNPMLIEYATEKRCIPINVLNRYCSQVKYHLRSNTSRSYFKIGFKNNEGGWALRGSKSKISSGSGISTFNSSGELTSVPSTRRAFIFEGFFDFLAWIAWNGGETPMTDACVLNSVSNLHRAEEWLKSHSEIAVCFDNDQAGRNAFQQVKEFCKSSEVKDCSSIYKGFNDLNDFFVHRCNARKAQAKEEQQEPPSSKIKL